MTLDYLIDDKVVRNELMSKHTTLGIGGPADLFVVAHAVSELRDYVRLARDRRIPYLILGEGANLLVGDRGIRGLVIHNQCASIEFAPADGDAIWLVTAESGTAMRVIAHQSMSRGLAGLEWAVDVPGTVGGAVVGNAGAFDSYVSDSLQGVMVLSPDDVERWWPSEELELVYRSSRFKAGERVAGFGPVILSATFALHKEGEASVRQRAAEYSKRRTERQPAGLSAGSVFKRSRQYPAGFLIESAGLKGRRVGGAIVSPKHANFIINLGTATARDVLDLIHIVRDTVYEQFEVMLELEIELVGER